jgi:heat shock protein HslJ
MFGYQLRRAGHSLIFVLGAFLLAGSPLIAQQEAITGTATLKERAKLPSAAVLEVLLEDVTPFENIPVQRIGGQRLTAPGDPPFKFSIPYEKARILPDHQYVVRARIFAGETDLFRTVTPVKVITGDNPTTVTLTLDRVKGRVSASPPTPGRLPLPGIYWRATEIGGKPVVATQRADEQHLRFEKEGRVTGSDGCNRLTGNFTLKGADITFDGLTGTLMACPAAAGADSAFREAIKTAARVRIGGNLLELFDRSDKRVAAFAADEEGRTRGLAGTAWRLLEFQGGDDTTLSPKDPSRYTLEFGAGGRLTARIDCNRGRGTWKSSGPGELALGRVSLSRAKCPEGSLHDQIVKQLPNIRSYVLKDGHLFLSLAADGGVYEFEPLPKGGPR